MDSATLDTNRPDIMERADFRSDLTQDFFYIFLPFFPPRFSTTRTQHIIYRETTPDVSLTKKKARFPVRRNWRATFLL